jgi:[acyl-carrier-protein] S-malonyltransferase
VILLKVSAPFHCALMTPAQARLAADLERLSFNNPAVPVITNVDARAVTAPAELRDALVRQVSAPVRWVESMQLLIGQGVNTFVEAGPGKVLSGLIRQISRDVKTLNVEDAASLETTKAALAA